MDRFDPAEVPEPLSDVAHGLGAGDENYTEIYIALPRHLAANQPHELATNRGQGPGSPGTYLFGSTVPASDFEDAVEDKLGFPIGSQDLETFAR